MIGAFKKSILSLGDEVSVLKSQSDNQDGSINSQRRRLYSELEILRIDIDEAQEAGKVSFEEKTKLHDDIDRLLPQLTLEPISRPSRWWSPLEMSCRFMGMVSAFVFVGTFLSLPIIFMRLLEDALEYCWAEYPGNRNPFISWSESFKRWVVRSLLFQSGILVEQEGFERESFTLCRSTLLCFSHASSLDGFFVSGFCPVRQLAFGKKELFMVPFFSWLSLAIGGIPVDRSNRDRAIRALRRSIEVVQQEQPPRFLVADRRTSSTKDESAGSNSSSNSGGSSSCSSSGIAVAKRSAKALCIAIAPEGTRSSSGNLLPFKKGTFYIWEELQSPIVPFLILGAYDLYPVRSWVNNTGVVTIRFLPPIFPGEARGSKEQMLRIVRRRMLESLAIAPSAKIGSEISTAHWLASLAANVLSMSSLVGSCWLLRELCKWHPAVSHASTLQLSAFIVAAVVAVTAGLYAFFVYGATATLSATGKRKEK